MDLATVLSLSNQPQELLLSCDYVPAPPDAHLPSLADQVEFVSPSDGQYRIRILPHWRQAPETWVMAWGDCVGDELLHHHVGLGYYCAAALHRGVGEIGVGGDGLKRDRYYHVWFLLLDHLANLHRSHCPTPSCSTAPPLGNVAMWRAQHEPEDPFLVVSHWGRGQCRARQVKYPWRYNTPEENAARAAVQARVVAREKIQDAQFWATCADVNAAIDLMRDDFVNAWGPRFSPIGHAK
ncbi:hypothetical protein B0H14DRAFT_2651874 [Mycena olivaceomarginata]|nr:hypothetical protein B0H14DRAFT_2651874 [Mycena olivaceomarginata]